MHWYKRDPDAALSGMLGLTLEERAVYNTLIDLAYARDLNVPDDERYLAMVCGCHWRTFRTIRASLIAKGKLSTGDGVLMPRGCQKRFKEASEFSQKQSKNAKSRWNSTKDLDFGNASTTTTTKKDLSSLTSSLLRPAREAEPVDNSVPAIAPSAELLAIEAKKIPTPSELATALPTGALARSATAQTRRAKSQQEGPFELSDPRGNMAFHRACMHGENPDPFALYRKQPGDTKH